MSSDHVLLDRVRQMANASSIYRAARSGVQPFISARWPLAISPRPLSPASPMCLTSWQAGQRAIIRTSRWMPAVSSYSHTSWHSTGCLLPRPPQTSQRRPARSYACDRIRSQSWRDTCSRTFENQQVLGTSSIVSLGGVSLSTQPMMPADLIEERRDAFACSGWYGRCGPFCPTQRSLHSGHGRYRPRYSTVFRPRPLNCSARNYGCGHDRWAGSHCSC
jgi:hypothetical protein